MTSPADQLTQLATQAGMSVEDYWQSMAQSDYCWLAAWSDPECGCPRCLNRPGPMLVAADANQLHVSAGWKAALYEQMTGQPAAGWPSLAELEAAGAPDKPAKAASRYEQTLLAGAGALAAGLLLSRRAKR